MVKNFIRAGFRPCANKLKTSRLYKVIYCSIFTKKSEKGEDGSQKPEKSEESDKAVLLPANLLIPDPLRDLHEDESDIFKSPDDHFAALWEDFYNPKPIPAPIIFPPAAKAFEVNITSDHINHLDGATPRSVNTNPRFTPRAPPYKTKRQASLSRHLSELKTLTCIYQTRLAQLIQRYSTYTKPSAHLESTQSLSSSLLKLHWELSTLQMCLQSEPSARLHPKSSVWTRAWAIVCKSRDLTRQLSRLLRDRAMYSARDVAALANGYVSAVRAVRNLNRDLLELYTPL